MMKDIKIRTATPDDSATLLSLSKECVGLDVHTHYTYWVMCNYHNDTIFILEDDQIPIGYIMALNVKSAIFIWQIGIIADYRGKSLSEELIAKIAYTAAVNHKPIELSIIESNGVSLSAFTAFCKKHGLTMSRIGQTSMGKCDESLYRSDIT